MNANETFSSFFSPFFEYRKGSIRESRENEMAHIQDVQPTSPHPSFLNQTDSSYVSDSSPSSSLSSDSIKFLKFAGIMFI